MVTGARPVPCTDSSGAGLPPRPPVPSACSAGSIDHGQPRAVPCRFPGSASGDPPRHPQQVLLAVERVVVGARPGRDGAADRLVVVERATPARPRPGSARAAAARSSCTRAAGISPSSRHSEPARDRARRAPRRSRASTGSTAPERVGRDLEAEAVHRLVAPGAGLLQRGHQHQRGQVAEVAGRARHALVEVRRGRGSAAASSRSASCVTTQSVTCQPCRPCRSVACTVSSTALKNANGIEPSSTSSRNATPGADRRRVDPQPDRGQERVRRPADDLDRRAGAGRPLDADRRGLAEARPRGRSRSASVAWMTSFCTSP